MRTWIVALVVAIALAGCTEEPAKDPEGAGDTDPLGTDATQNETTPPPSQNATDPTQNATSPPSAPTNETETAPPPTGPETYYLHAAGTGADETSMDHVPADAEEEGSRTVLIVQPTNGGYNYTFPSTEATRNQHDAGAAVEVRFFAATIAPHPAVAITGTLSSGGTELGTGTDTQAVLTLYSSGYAPTFDCVEFTLTFTSASAIPVGTDLSLHVSTDYPLHLFPCFMGGEDAARMVLGAA